VEGGDGRRGEGRRRRTRFTDSSFVLLFHLLRVLTEFTYVEEDVVVDGNLITRFVFSIPFLFLSINGSSC